MPRSYILKTHGVKVKQQKYRNQILNRLINCHCWQDSRCRTAMFLQYSSLFLLADLGGKPDNFPLHKQTLTVASPIRKPRKTHLKTLKWYILFLCTFKNLLFLSS